MLVVQNIRVRSLSTEYVHVTWQLEPTVEDVGDYDFFVLRSEGQAGPYELLSGPLVDTYVFRDNRALDTSLNRTLYYRVRVTHRISLATAEYGSRSPEEIGSGLDPGGVSRDPAPTLIAREIAYRTRVANRAYAGRLVWIFQVRTWGTRCKDCWNPLLKQKKKEHCETCYQTSWAGGYHRPIEVSARLVSEQPSGQLMPWGRVDPDQVVFRLPEFPEIKPGDVLVEPENDIWRIVRCPPSHVQGSLVGQTAICGRIIKTDVEYRIPIRGVDPIRFEPIDSRQYTNPSNLEAHEASKNKFQPPEV